MIQMGKCYKRGAKRNGGDPSANAEAASQLRQLCAEHSARSLASLTVLHTVALLAHTLYDGFHLTCDFFREPSLLADTDGLDGGVESQQIWPIQAVKSIHPTSLVSG